MNARQVNPKTVKFVRDHDIDFHVLVDRDRKVIDRFGVGNDELAEAIEEGVPHPTTYVLDRDGKVVLMDVRKDFHHWLSSTILRDILL